MSNTDTNATDGVAAKELKAIVDRIERLEDEKKGVSDDIKDIYNEAASKGYDKKVLRQVIRARKKSAAEREEERNIQELYEATLGMA